MNILNPAFKYVNAASTDISKTIKREQARLRKIATDKILSEAALRQKLVPIAGRK